MKKSFCSNTEVINYIWQYSKYHGNLLSYCQKVSQGESGNGFVSLIFCLI